MTRKSGFRLALFVLGTVALEAAVSSRGMNSVRDGIVVVSIPIAVAPLVWFDKIFFGSHRRTFLFIASPVAALVLWIHDRDIIAAAICASVFARILVEVIREKRGSAGNKKR